MVLGWRSSAAQNIFYVSTNGTGITGLSWADAFGDIQQAIDASMEGDQIWVAEGVYYPRVEFDADGSGGSDNREKTFYIRKNISLYGGFQEGDTQISQRDHIHHPVILSGDLGVIMDTIDNAYHVVIVDGSTPHGNINETCLLDGFFIESGVASGMLAPHVVGSGMFNIGTGAGNVCSPTIRDCTFSNNHASYGGTVYNYAMGGNCSPTFINCSFTNNSSYAGAAVFNNAYDGICNSTYFNCDFIDNHASYAGGALFNYANHGVCNLVIHHSAFINNYTQIGGAMYNSSMEGSLEASIVNSVFSQNYAEHKGGALFNYGYSGQSHCNIINTTFFKNTGVHNGGAVRNWYATSQITNCILWNNGDEVFNTFGSATLLHSILDDGSPGNGSITYLDSVSGQHVIDLDPLFCDYSGAGNMRLKQNSPAIDFGTFDTTGLQLPVIDLDGKDRFNEIVDLGAYENPYVNCPDTIVVDSLYGAVAGLYEAQNEIQVEGGVDFSTGVDVMLSAPTVLLSYDISIDTGAIFLISEQGCVR